MATYQGIELPAAEVAALQDLERVRREPAEHVPGRERLGGFHFNEEDGHVVRLQVKYYKAPRLPDSIGNFAALEELNLSRCEFRAIPDSIGNLTALKVFDAQHGRIEHLPGSIGNLTSLERVNLGGYNRIRSIPGSIGTLANLEQLSVTGSFTTIPDSIGTLATLKQLKLSGWFDAIPGCIGALASLVRLDLGCPRLLSFPDNFGSLSSLEWLKIKIPPAEGESTPLVLPDSIGALSSLKWLDLFNDEHLFTIPDAIGDLSSLIGIDLLNTGLDDIPPVLCTLPRLQVCLFDYLYENMGCLEHLPRLRTKPWLMDDGKSLEQNVKDYTEDLVKEIPFFGTV